MKIPNIARGAVVPPTVEELEFKKAQDKIEKKQQNRHDYAVAAFSSICGGIAGLLSSFIFWLCTK